jgi:hypothetical protein
VASYSGDGEYRFGQPQSRRFTRPSTGKPDTGIAVTQASCNVALICLALEVDTTAHKGSTRRQVGLGVAATAAATTDGYPYEVEVLSPAALPKTDIVKQLRAGRRTHPTNKGRYAKGALISQSAHNLFFKPITEC